MTANDPLDRYAELMSRAHTPERLSRDVLARIGRESDRTASPRGSAHDDPETRAASSYPHAEPAPAPRSFSMKRHRFKGAAIAACLVLLAVVVGASLSMPHLGKHAAPFGFVVKAYGASGNTILAMGDDGRILFESDILFRVPSGERYAEEGVYTGCMFRVQGDDIVRVRAHIDKGELYRYTYDEFSLADDPDRWEEAKSWNSTKIGQDGRFEAFDLVQPVNRANVDEQASTDQTVAVKCYQRLGSTVDVAVEDADGSRLDDYSFGFWTNEDVGSATGYQDYIDSLDGATLTVTVEKSDGSSATKVIELSSADVKAAVMPSDPSTSIELLPEVLDAEGMDPQEVLDLAQQGFTWVRTLYGTIVEQSDEPFPFDDAALPSLERPLTKPAEAEPAAAPAATEIEDSWVINKQKLDLGSSLEVRFPKTADPSHERYPEGSVPAVLRCGNVAASKDLPDGFDVENVARLRRDAIELSQEENGPTIGEDGRLSEGFSYVTIDVMVTNASTGPLQADVSAGRFGTLRPANGEEYFASAAVSCPFWASGRVYDPYDPFSRFVEVKPGETRTFTLLGIATDDEMADPGFSFYYDDTSYGGRSTASFVIGSMEAAE